MKKNFAKNPAQAVAHDFRQQPKANPTPEYHNLPLAPNPPASEITGLGRAIDASQKFTETKEFNNAH
jgi:hypothetical protein